MNHQLGGFMSDRGHVEMLRAAVAALNGGDVDGYLKHFDPSCRRWVAGFDQPLTLSDISDSLVQLRAAFDPLHLEEELLFDSDRFVCARWRLHGVHVGEYLGFAATGREIDVRHCEVYEFVERVVVETWTYGDPGELFRQIGPVAEQDPAR